MQRNLVYAKKSQHSYKLPRAFKNRIKCCVFVSHVDIFVVWILAPLIPYLQNSGMFFQLDAFCSSPRGQGLLVH
jgi:hypothetical protein